jgi:glycosyltransferase involved in cell wall biosynthesis
MRILLLAPHPFFTQRGTPIAVRLVCEGLSRLGHIVDVLTYHEGENIDCPGVTIHRIDQPRFVRRVPIGPSWQKIVCDIALARRLRRMLRENRYDLIHAVEESAFLAARTGLPFVFDMDSLMSQQLVERSKLFWPASVIFKQLERGALCRCVGVLAVCESLAREARKHQSNVHVLPDVALAANGACALPELLIKTRGLRLMYVGNLQRYQGIDLMLEAFATIAPAYPDAVLVIVGGNPAQIAAYTRKAARSKVIDQVRFVGEIPIDALARTLSFSDILVSPRIKGENTPMKLYSYLMSGRPVLATRLPTHLQVVADEHAFLVEPTVEAMAKGMRALIDSPELRERLGTAGRALASRCYGLDSFRQRLEAFYQKIAA